jgi:hypothetical protein
MHFTINLRTKIDVCHFVDTKGERGLVGRNVNQNILSAFCIWWQTLFTSLHSNYIIINNHISHSASKRVVIFG